MREIIKDRTVVQDDWNVLKLEEEQSPDTVEVPDGRTIVPLTVWFAQRETLLARLREHGDIAVWFASDERPEALKEDVGLFGLVAVDFPKFADGRGYSIAYNLRLRHGYTGELRAIGDVLRDQLFYMQRVGFDSFATRPDRNIHDALKGLTDFSEAYQTAWDRKTPLFRRVQRAGKGQQQDQTRTQNQEQATQ
ncbi:MAG: hypothetical protein JWR22_1275 [Herminiimonas sp.]|nr:hypothetical protein [Herminiimonas sp.]